VASGETLWGLSRQWAEERGVSVNQMMLAIQRSNPDAFQGENINRMMAGAILRLPDGEEARRMDQRQAMLEVLRQEQAWRARRGLPGEPDDLPSIADLAQQGASSEEGPPARSSKPDSRLELVPPAEQGEGGAGEPGRGAEQEAGAIRGESMEEELARAQEELANARQENAYLAERLEELERELESARELVDGGAAGAGEGNVADTNLAELEERLRRERQSGARQEEELAVTPRGAEEKGDGRLGLALLALVVLLVGGLVWWFRSTAADDERASSDRS
jgi:pilus assembly protein FimV